MKHIKLSPVTMLLLLLVFFNLKLSLRINDFRFERFYTAGSNIYADSFAPIHDTLRHQQKKGVIYDQDYKEKRVKFIYPPTSLLPFIPFREWPFEEFKDLFANIINRIVLGVSLIGVLLVCRRLLLGEEDSLAEKLAKSAACIALTALFYPFSNAFVLGQVQVWINCLIFFSLLFLLQEREIPAGLCLAACAALKPTYGVLLIWALLARKKKFALWMGGALLVWAAFSLSFYNIADYVDYFKLLSILSRHGETYFPNQSFNGLMNRLLFNGSIMKWDAKNYPPFNWAVYGTTMAATIILYTTAFVTTRRRTKKRGDGTLLTYLIVILTVTVTSPVSWEHHYGFMAIIYVAALHYILKIPGAAKWGLLAVLTLSYLAAGHFHYYIDMEFGETSLNFLQSYIFFGALLLLGILYHLLFREEAPLRASLP